MAQADSAGLARSICDAERAAIARALNLLDDHRPAAQEQAAQLLQELAARCREPHRRRNAVRPMTARIGEIIDG